MWRSVKYGEVYRRAHDYLPDARSGLVWYFGFYNTTRMHQALGGLGADDVYL